MTANKILTREDELKLAMLFDTITSEVEYCFDLNYNGVKTWSVEERADALIKCIQSYVKRTPKDLATDYDEEHWSDWIQKELKELYHEYNLGDKVSLYYDGLPTFATIISCGYGEYGLLLDGKHKLVFIEDGCDSPTNYIIKLQKLINIE